MANILLIDDDTHIRAALEQLLRLDQHQVTLAQGLQERRHCGRRDRFDLVVTGTLTTLDDAIEIIDSLINAGGGVPIVALSSRNGLLNAVFDVEAASALGIKVVLVRNLVRADLRQAISAALN